MRWPFQLNCSTAKDQPLEIEMLIRRYLAPERTRLTYQYFLGDMLSEVDISPICAFRPCGKVELDGDTGKKQHKSSFEGMSFRMQPRKIKREALAFDSLFFFPICSVYILFVRSSKKESLLSSSSSIFIYLFLVS